MKTFLKVLLIAALVIIALKLSPILFLAALVGLVAAVVLGAVGLSLAAVLVGVTIAFVVALAPIWIPVLAVMGLVHLYRRHKAAAPAPVATA
jgi:hypothetical protein